MKQKYYELTEVTIAEVTTIKRVLATDRLDAFDKFEAGEGVVISCVPGTVSRLKSHKIEPVEVGST